LRRGVGLVHATAVHTRDHQGHLGIGAIGAALVDDAIAELEQPRHVALAVIVIERDER
jgi:hypothetical protein